MDGPHFKYGPHPLQTARIFHYSPENTHTLLFIHGGAWRDPTNTYDDFAQLVDTLQAEIANTNLVSMNYRLSPEIQHPEHLMDVLECVRLLALQNCTLLIVGHSVGATLMMQMLNYKEILAQKNLTTEDLPELKLGTFFFVDGIYDMVDLVQEYVLYKDFVEMAFAGEYKGASPLSNPQKLLLAPAKILVVYSEEDELLSDRQSRAFVEYLRAHNHSPEYLHGKWGLHEEVYRRPELAEIIIAGMK